MASDEHVIGPVAARLSDAQIDLLRRHGQERATTQGEVLFREGDRGYDFLVILAGTVVAVDGYGGAQRELAVGFPGDFVAELNLLTGERLYTTAVIREPGAVLAVPVAELTQLIGAHPDLGEVIMPVLLARREWLARRHAGFQIIGSRYSPTPAVCASSRAATGLRTTSSTSTSIPRASGCSRTTAPRRRRHRRC